MIGLLQSDEVRQELDLMDDQVEQLRTIGDDIRQPGPRRIAGRVPGHARFVARRAPAADSMKSARRSTPSSPNRRGRLQEVLLPHQFDRLKQIDLQARIQRGGASALTDGELAETSGPHRSAERTASRAIRSRCSRNCRKDPAAPQRKPAAS